MKPLFELKPGTKFEYNDVKYIKGSERIIENDDITIDGRKERGPLYKTVCMNDDGSNPPTYSNIPVSAAINPA